MSKNQCLRLFPKNSGEKGNELIECNAREADVKTPPDLNLPSNSAFTLGGPVLVLDPAPV